MKAGLVPAFVPRETIPLMKEINPMTQFKPKQVTIFDLDRTVIDSDQRTPYNGQDLDLAGYRALQTHENIMQDTLLPLAKYMQALIQRGETVVIVTARRMIKSDYIYLRKNGCKAAYICSRDQLFKRFDNATATMIYNHGDANYKWHWFNHLQGRFPLAQFTVYDDHKGVLEVAKSFGFQTYDAVAVNEMLTMFLDMGFEEGLAQGFDEGYLDGQMSTVHQVINFESDEYIESLGVNTERVA